MIIGIDLGTTNSLVSYFTEDGPKIIPNRLGEHLTPSIISIDENDQLFIGKTAKERMLLFPESSVSVFKRDMGTDKKFELGNKKFTAEELSSFILRTLKEDAEEFLGEPITEAVISVPAYFNDDRRRATKRAGELAGLKVERIISEPTAAAIAYGLYKSSSDSKFLVFDLGGGTFDVSILELFGNILEVHAVAGDNFLGGEDFTDVLVQLFLEDKKLDLLNLDYKTLVHIKKQAEICKENLNKDEISTMSCKIGEEILSLKIDLNIFEKKCKPLFERMEKPIKRSLLDAKLKVSEIDQIILIGGATKLYLVQEFVKKLFKKEPNTSINPDEAVALGAAVQGAIKERKDEIKEVILTDVCPFTLGTEVVKEVRENYFQNGYFFPIIERNTVIPASRTERLYTVNENQKEIRVSILQGESRFAENNLFLGEIVVKVPENKAGKEAIDVTYTYDINSILEVEVTAITTGEKEKILIKGQNLNMTDEEIEARMKELSYLKIHPREYEENKLLLLRAERMYEENLGDEREKIGERLAKFDVALNSRDKRVIEKERIKLMEVLEFDFISDSKYFS